MAKGKRPKIKTFKKLREDEEKVKTEPTKEKELKRLEEKCFSRINTYFKSDEIQDICGLLNIEELSDQQCLLGAVVIGKFDIVKRLLKEGHSIDQLDENRETALMHAVRHFRVEMVDFLLTRGADISLADAEGNTVLQVAAQSTFWDQDTFSGLWNSVRNHPGLRVNHANKTGYTLLHYVTKRQWRIVLDLILSGPITVDCCTNKAVTPLIMAASRGDAGFVKALLEAGADFTVEDQQKCTALCYAIAFSLQKNNSEPNRALELILAAVNDEDSKLPLEQYLQRRLDLLLNPPKSKIDFSKTVNGVLVHVLTFFARYIYSGMELLMELSIFQRFKEALERHMEDSGYTTALLGVTLELVRHCDCCCQGLSQPELADSFFSAGLGKAALNILHRFGTNKLGVVKAVFLPLLYLCTSESYKARTWLEASHGFLQPFYNKYQRSFPAIFLDTDGDPHLAIEKQRSLSFQKLMKTLKTQGYIVSKEEHAKAAQKLKEDMTLAHSVYTVMKPKSSNAISNALNSSPEKGHNTSKKTKSKPSTVYNSIIQYNFGKLDIVQNKKDTPFKEQLKPSTTKKENISNPSNLSVKPQKGRKSRIAIREIQQKQLGESSSNENVLDKTQPNIKAASSETKASIPNRDTRPKKYTSTRLPVKERFSDGFQLFQMDDDTLSEIEDEKDIIKNTCEWVDTYASGDGNKTVSSTEVANTIKYLQEIFNRIIKRYDSTWTKQFEEGYLGARGDCEDLLKLMTVLPALENYHMGKLINKWDNFCKQVQDHARKNHVVYAALVSEMQLFLLEFEAELDQKNIKVFNDYENSSLDSYIETESIFKRSNDNDLNTLSDGKPVEYLFLMNKTKDKTKKEGNGIIDKAQDSLDKPLNLKTDQAEFIDSVYISDSEDEEDDLNEIGIWDTKVKIGFKKTSELNVNGEDNDYKPTTEETLDVSINETEIVSTQQEINQALSHFITTSIDTYGEVCDFSLSEKNQEERVITSPFFNTTLFTNPSPEKISAENSCMSFGILQPEKKIETESDNSLSTLLNPPPGFDDTFHQDSSFKNLTSTFCGTKYNSLTLSLLSLPACKTELLDGGSVRLATTEFQQDFKLFGGCNFGDVELGLSASGMPLAVRRFQKHDTLCNKTVSEGLKRSILPMLNLTHKHILPYVASCDLPKSLVFVTPLCHQDLGQYMRQVRAAIADNPQNLITINPHLHILAKQLMSGLLFLHTQSKPIVHGNLKPSNILVDSNGTLQIAEFGLHEMIEFKIFQMLFQQQGPALTSMIWWARECHVQYFNTWKFECTQKSDMQSAGMLLHFILTIGQHPYGQNLTEIIENIKNGVVLLRSQDVNAIDLLYWMLSHEPERRPDSYEVLRHVLFWNTNQRWDFLMMCCGLRKKQGIWPLPLEMFYKDLDLLGQLRDVNTKWISTLKENCGKKIGSCNFKDTPSGLLKFLKKIIGDWSDFKDIFLELFPVLPLNIFRMIEQTVWIDHPEIEPFTKVDELS